VKTRRASATGAGLAIVVNANAKRGGRRIAVQIGEVLPGAVIRLTKSADEVQGFLRSLGPTKAVMAAGGDGSAVTLLTALDAVTPQDRELPAFGVLPLGTGNAFAHSLGARSLDACVRALARHRGPLPTRSTRVFSCDEKLTFFAGSGWDAEILDDYRAQLESAPSRRVAKSVWGYLSAVALRTAPKTFLHGKATVRIESLAPEVYGIDARGAVRRLEGIGMGSLLYEGPASVAGCATCPEFGYRFRAYPHAERMPGMMNVRVYEQTTLRAIRDIPRLWHGQHPLDGMTDWFTSHVRMTFSRDVPLQVGGEAVGRRRIVDYRIAPRTIRAIDFRRLL
jgi:diacylglycerol kinase family enzyme